MIYTIRTTKAFHPQQRVSTPPDALLTYHTFSGFGQAMARFVADGMAPKQAQPVAASRDVPPPEDVLVSVQSVVVSILGADVPQDQPLMQVCVCAKSSCD